MDTTKRPTAAQALSHKWLQLQSKVTVDESKANHALDNLINFHSHATMKAATLTFIGS